MITLEEARANIGRRVTYRPPGGVVVGLEETEHGVITSVNDWYVFVRYDRLPAAANGRATRPDDLEWADHG